MELLKELAQRDADIVALRESIKEEFFGMLVEDVSYEGGIDFKPASAEEKEQYRLGLKSATSTHDSAKRQREALHSAKIGDIIMTTKDGKKTGMFVVAANNEGSIEARSIDGSKSFVVDASKLRQGPASKKHTRAQTAGVVGAETDDTEKAAGFLLAL